MRSANDELFSELRHQKENLRMAYAAHELHHQDENLRRHFVELVRNCKHHQGFTPAGATAANIERVVKEEAAQTVATMQLLEQGGFLHPPTHGAASCPVASPVQGGG